MVCELKKALITGILGQDGRHLTKLLLEKDYKVFGLIKGQRKEESQKFLSAHPEVKLLEGDLTDFSSLLNAVSVSKPDEIYNLAAISHVGLSFKQPELTANVNAIGPLRILECLRKLKVHESVKVYQASTSEMFGKVQESPQTENTAFYPRSPYGFSKTFAHFACVNYRESYGMHISSGILFNHESEFRGYEFVTRKITSNIAKIIIGKIKNFQLGSLEPRRDWGYAGDYVEAMWLMVQQRFASDYVVATGETHSVREFLELALITAGLEPDVERYTSINPDFLRPAEVDFLLGDYSKAQSELGWIPKVNFQQMIAIMIENDLRIEHENL